MTAMGRSRKSSTTNPDESGYSSSDDMDAADEADLDKEQQIKSAGRLKLPTHTSTADIHRKIEAAPVAAKEKTKKKTTAKDENYDSADEADKDTDTDIKEKRSNKEEKIKPTNIIILNLAYRLANAFQLSDFNETAIKNYLINSIATLNKEANIYENDLLVMGMHVERFLQHNPGTITDIGKAKQLMMVYLEYFLDERNEAGSEPFAIAAGLGSIQDFSRTRDEFFHCNKEYGIVLSRKLHEQQLKNYKSKNYKSLVEDRDPNPFKESTPIQLATDIKPSKLLSSIDSNKFKNHAISLVNEIVPLINQFIAARIDTKDKINFANAIVIFEAATLLKQSIIKNDPEEKIILQYQILLETICKTNKEAQGWFSELRVITVDLSKFICEALKKLLPSEELFKKDSLAVLHQIVESGHPEEKVAPKSNKR